MGFFKKIEIFPPFYLRQNVFLDYKSKTDLNKVEKLALFSKGLVHGFG